MGQKPETRPIKIVQRNKKAFHDFEILQKFEAGIVLTGPEVKSIRQGKCSLQDAYCMFSYNFEVKSDKLKKRKVPHLELVIKNFHISQYEQANEKDYNPRRERKILLNKNELIRLKSALEQKGLALIPISIYFSGPYVKLELSLVKPKKKYDKREEIKKRDIEKEISMKLRR